jgi:hypothetical protein
LKGSEGVLKPRYTVLKGKKIY